MRSERPSQENRALTCQLHLLQWRCLPRQMRDSGRPDEAGVLLRRHRRRVPKPSPLLRRAVVRLGGPLHVTVASRICPGPRAVGIFARTRTRLKQARHSRLRRCFFGAGRLASFIHPWAHRMFELDQPRAPSDTRTRSGPSALAGESTQGGSSSGPLHGYPYRIFGARAGLSPLVDSALDFRAG